MIVTLEQARAMRWPFRNPRQPMGLLLDQGTIAAPDLQRASRAAYSPRFKAACLLLLRELVPTPNGSTAPISFVSKGSGKNIPTCSRRPEWIPR